MTFVLGLLAVTAVLASILLMFVILLQEPKGGGIASALGGSGMEAVGVNVGSVNRFTAWVAGVWIGACLLHAILQPVGADLSSPLPPPGGAGTKTEVPPGGGGTEPGNGSGNQERPK